MLNVKAKDNKLYEITKKKNLKFYVKKNIWDVISLRLKIIYLVTLYEMQIIDRKICSESIKDIFIRLIVSNFVRF